MEASSSLCLPRFSWSHTCLYHGASETDLISIAGAASFQLFKLCSNVEGYICSSLTKPRALFLLLGSGGLSLWILYRKKDGSPRRDSSKSLSLARESNVSWLKWLFSEGEKDFFLLREDNLSPVSMPPPPRGKQPSIAPCPNCQRGTCRLRKHQMCISNSSSSHGNSPISRRESSSRFLPPTSTPDSADDENSDSEDIIYLQISGHHGRRRRSGSWLSNSGSFIANRSEGEGMSDPSMNGSNIYYPTAKLYTASKRSPGDGQDRLCATYGPSSLSSGEPCDCTECLNLAYCRYEREESVDSIISATGSMVELIKGAREVRKLIREASFDSLASDLSFKAEKGGAPTIKVVEPGPGDPHQEEYGEEGGHLDDVPPCLRINQSLNKNFYSMIALSSLDFDPTTSSSGVNSLEWESPSHGWHDVREAKYKMSLPPDSDAELEWDADMGDCLSIHEDEFVSSSFLTGLELDMETELLQGPSSSACSSRRSSFGSRSTIGKRLPPSGRSSAERELSEPPHLVEENKFTLSPLIEESGANLSPGVPSRRLLKNSDKIKSSVPSCDSLYISLRRGRSPPDNIEIMNNNST